MLFIPGVHAGTLFYKMANAIFSIYIIGWECQAQFIKFTQVFFHFLQEQNPFADLVRRHGPVVYRVCRRLVGSDADDAFQAVFLVLATRPGAARAAGSVGGWLVGVAGRVARQMGRAAGRRTRHESAAAGQSKSAPPEPSIDLADQFRALDEELARLPDRLRAPVVLCLLEGRTQEQAADEIGRDDSARRASRNDVNQTLGGPSMAVLPSKAPRQRGVPRSGWPALYVPPLPSTHEPPQTPSRDHRVGY